MRKNVRWVGVLLAILLLAACSDKDPDQVAKDFYEAFERHEFSKAKDDACSSLHDELNLWTDTVGDQKIDVALNVTYEQVEKSDDKIWIRVSGTKQLQGETYAVNYRIRLDKKDGWKVCDMRSVAGP